jgi:predicted tellurium resistance membrane protein TerC
MARLVLLAALLTATACVKEKKGDEYKTSDLTPHYLRTVAGSIVVCDAWFTVDDSSTAVALESDALVTCNGNVMTLSGTLYTGSTPYSAGGQVAISLIRPIDGSNLTDTATVY